MGYCISSIIFSLVGLTSVLLVWVVGSSRYGVFSRVAHVTGIPSLLLVSLLSFVISVFIILNYSDRTKLKTFFLLIILFICVIPFIFFLYILFVRFFYGAD